MALTSQVQVDLAMESERWVRALVTCDNSYPAGGYPLPPSLFGLNAFLRQKFGGGGENVIFPAVIGGCHSSAQVICDVDTVTGKMRIFYPSGGGAASPGALANPAIATGAVAMTSAAANGANDLVPGVGKEIATGTNCTTVSVLLEAFGH